MELFKNVRAKRNPDLNVLPTRDVPTRWNSKELAIDRVLQLQETILLFCRKCPGCPIFPEETFEILELIQPALKIFANLTATYSAKEANLYRVLPDLHHAISELERMGSDPVLTSNRSKSFNIAAAKIKKYMMRFLQNDWVCAASALAPDNRSISLELLLKAYGQKRRHGLAVKWIKERLRQDVQRGEDALSPPPSSQPEADSQSGRPPNEFCSRRNLPVSQTVFDNAWDLWNADSGAKFLENENESVLQYWKRMDRIPQLKPLAKLARDILGVPASSTSVERLFSQAGLLATKRRNLSPRMQVKQTCLKVWSRESYYFGGEAKAPSATIHLP